MKRVAAQALLGALLVAGCSSAVHSTRADRIDARSVAAPTCRSEPEGRSPRVRWVGPDEPGEKARLDSWCAAVGPALIHDKAAPIEPRLDEILFASWNLHVGAADVERFVRDVRSGRLSEGRRP